VRVSFHLLLTFEMSGGRVDGTMKFAGVLKEIRYSAQICKILLRDHGYFQSVARGEYRDADGAYIPWFTYPAIEALKNWDLSDKRVFEYGSGYSTLFWAAHAKEVISVEHDPAWHATVSSLAPANAKIILAPIDEQRNLQDPSHLSHEEFDRYAGAIEGQFQIIVVDGYARSRVRYQCARAALPHLDDNGLMILDNSDWLPATALFLRNSGLIEVDFSGPVPGNVNHQTTSFFLTRQFNFNSANPRQPRMPIGGVAMNWESNLEQELLRGDDPQSSDGNGSPDGSGRV